MHPPGEHTGSAHILLVIVLLSVIGLASIQTVDAVCAAGEYECYNDNCIVNSLVNDSINDCGDNSDEGGLFTCKNDNLFKCTSGAQCYDLTWVNDGTADCTADQSDELKILGSTCGDPTKTPAVFTVLPCDDPRNIGDGAFCDRATYQCACKPGYAANARGNVCTIRSIDDPCSVDVDCSGAVPNSLCTGSVCQCDPNFLEYNKTYCQGRKIGDPCTTFEQCNSLVPYSRCSDGGFCECAIGLIPETSTNLQCLIPPNPTRPTTGPPSTRTSSRFPPSSSTTTMYPTFSDENSTDTYNSTEEPVTMEPPPEETVFTIPVIIGIVIAVGFVAMVVFIASCLLFVLLLAYAKNKGPLQNTFPDTFAMAKNLDYLNLEAELPRLSTILPPLDGDLATVHFLNELPFADMNGGLNLHSPDHTPRNPPASPNGNSYRYEIGTTTTELPILTGMSTHNEDGMELIELGAVGGGDGEDGDGMPLIDGNGKHSAKVAPEGKGKKGKKGKKAKKKKKKKK